MPSNERKSEFLGMPFGTASQRLRKNILFMLLQRLGETKCFRCVEKQIGDSQWNINRNLR